MQPTESAHPGKAFWQDVLEKAGYEVQGLEGDRCEPAGAAFAIVPADLAVGQEVNIPIGGGGFEDVTGQIAQRILTRARRATVHVPVTLPHLGRDLREELGMFLLQPGFEEGAKVSAQGLDGQEELWAGADPLSAVRTEAAAGNEVMDVGVKDEGARPGVEHAQHAQLGSEQAGIGGQVLQGLRSAGEEQVQTDLLMRAEEYGCARAW